MMATCKHILVSGIAVLLSLLVTSARGQSEIPIPTSVFKLDINNTVTPTGGQPFTEQRFSDPVAMVLDNGLSFSTVDIGGPSPFLGDADYVTMEFVTFEEAGGPDPSFGYSLSGSVTAPPSNEDGRGLFSVNAKMSAPIKYINPNHFGLVTSIAYFPTIEGKLSRPDDPNSGLVNVSVEMAAITLVNGNLSQRTLASLSVSRTEVGDLNAFGESSEETLFSDSDGDNFLDSFEMNQGVFPNIVITENETFLLDVDVRMTFDYELYAAIHGTPSWDIDLRDTVKLDLIGPAGGRFEVVPEPSAALFLCGSSTLLGLRRRRL